MEYSPQTIRQTLAKHSGRRQSEIQANLDRQRVVNRQTLNRHGDIIVLVPDASALLDVHILAADVTLYPIQVLTSQLLVVITIRQIVDVLGFAVHNPVATGCGLGFRRIDLRLNHPWRLAEERPFVFSLHRLLLGQAMPPMIVVHRIGVGPNAAPGSAAIALGGIAPNAMR